ncbi:ATP-binding cassette domain-containing protein [Paenibacillus ginsengihumi]|uniref:ATP-binding cassette domain-containing protein n=1 Tax=Paenibacillus ginsengihumi TaxID=431596 RepID=UPI0003743F74|nr:ATP-binding cassette domain-containing protein [Paenibacillus ginsengihumi]
MPLTLQGVQVLPAGGLNAPLLKHTNLTLNDGTITLLIGRTGSGKTTLLQTLACLREPSSGNVLLDGQPLWRKHRVAKEHLLRLGLIFQFPEQQLFARSIREEFAYSLRPYALDHSERERRVRASCDELDPGGVLGPDRSPFALSGGEKRRLALATTFAAAPDWLLLDEPTAGLASTASSELIQLLRAKVSPGGGIVIATHDLDTFFPLADRVLLLAKGAIVFDGTPAELCRMPERLTAAGVGLPGCVKVAQALGCSGLHIAGDLLTPEATAEAIAGAIRARLAERSSPDNGGASGYKARHRLLEASLKAPPLGATLAIRSAAAASATAKASGAVSFKGAGPSAPAGGAIPAPVSDAAAAEATLPASVAAAAAGFAPMASDAAAAAELALPAFAADGGRAKPYWHRIDPRAKWLVYAALVAGVMLQDRWAGMAAAAVALLAAFLGAPRSAVRGGSKVAVLYLPFLLVSVGLAGLQWPGTGDVSAVGFAADKALATGLNVTRLFLVAMASYWLTVTTPYGSLAQGLYWALQFGQKLRLPVDSFVLAVSTLFRFIPLIIREWQRFSAIVRARGKAPLRPGSVRMRDVPALVVPLLLSLFYRAEEMVTAMQLKQAGGGTGAHPPIRLQWTRSDSLAAAAGLTGFGVLLWLRALLT